MLGKPAQADEQHIFFCFCCFSLAIKHTGLIEVTFGGSGSCIKLTLSIRCQNFFLKCNSIQYFFSDLNRSESESNEIIAMSIHFNNFPIISCFYTNCTSKPRIYCFRSKNQSENELRDNLP